MTTRTGQPGTTRAAAGRRPGGGAGTGPSNRGPRNAPRGIGAGGRRLSAAVCAFAVLWGEVQRGLRPLRSLQPLLGAELLDRAEQAPLRGHVPGRVIACTGMRTAPHTHQWVVLLARGDRTTALCITLRRDGAAAPWKVTDLGEPGSPPLPPARWVHVRDDEDPDHVEEEGAADQLAVETLPTCGSRAADRAGLASPRTSQVA